MQHYQCEDYSGIPRLGVYHVGDKNFYYKNSAMLEMSKTKKPTMAKITSAMQPVMKFSPS